MPKIHKELLVPYSAADMYSLVNDINKYSEFLPWCSSSEILDQSADKITAKLALSYSGFSQEFTTCNTLEETDVVKKIVLNLVSGPFSSFQGLWQFTGINNDGCKVELDIDFAFSNPLLAFTVGKFFEQVASELVNNFYKRAIAVYGSK